MSMVLLALPPPDHLLIERDRGQFVSSRRRRMMANVRAERLLKIPAEPSPRDCSRASRPWWSSASWVGSAPSTPEQRERRKNTRARPHRRALTNSATASQGLRPSSRSAIARRQALSLHGSTIISLPLGPERNVGRAIVRVRTAKSAVAGDHLLHAHFVGWQTAIVMKGMARTSARAPRHLSGLADAKVEQHCHRYGHYDEHESHGRLHPGDTGRFVPRSLSSRSNALLPRGGKYKDRATLRCPPAKSLAQRKRLRPLRTLGRIDGEASRRLAAPSDVPHRHIGALDVAPQSVR